MLEHPLYLILYLPTFHVCMCMCVCDLLINQSTDQYFLPFKSLKFHSKLPIMFRETHHLQEYPKRNNSGKSFVCLIDSTEGLRHMGLEFTL